MEFLIQRVWAFNLRGEAAVAFEAPKKMQDKTAACHFSGLRGLMKFPVELGCKSLNISHGVWDRGVFSSQLRLFQQSHCQVVREAAAGLPPGEAKMLELQSWCLGNGCCDHDCHSALHRAFAVELDDKAFMKEVFKQFISVRSGFSLLADFVFDWVAGRLHFTDLSSLDTLHCEELWRVLGLEPSWCEDLVDMELRFEGGCLCVARRFEGDRDIIKRVVRAQMRVWQFRSWTESRWLSIGGRARTYVACKLLGLPDLVDFCINTKNCSSYHLGNYSPTPAIDQFLTTIGLAAHVSETPLAVFVSDDRLPRLMQQVETDLEAELDMVSSISHEVRNRLAEVGGIPAQLLRHRVLQAGHGQASYIL